MKKILLLSGLFIILFSAAKAQSPGGTTSVEEQAAGYQLRLASKHYYTGLLCIGGGTVLYVAAVAGNPQNPSGGLVALGGVAYIVGTVFMIESYSHIGKAGRILMGNAKFGLGETQSGNLGLRYNF